MKCYFLMVVCLQVVPMHSAPLLLLWQNQMIMQQQAREQMRQQMQAMNEWSYPNYSQKPNEPQMMLILSETQLYKLLEEASNLKTTVKHSNENAETTSSNLRDEDSDSVVIDAATASVGKTEAVTVIPKKEKFLIGNIISAIPFLPIEINVPDTISWIYNGIASIIGSIGQRFPLYRPSAPVIAQENLRVLLQKLQAHNTNQAPNFSVARRGANVSATILTLVFL
ncbi:hypothetical protein ACJJTC_005462 [Scirpophaga incertulas]